MPKLSCFSSGMSPPNCSGMQVPKHPIWAAASIKESGISVSNRWIDSACGTTTSLAKRAKLSRTRSFSSPRPVGRRELPRSSNAEPICASWLLPYCARNSASGSLPNSWSNCALSRPSSGAWFSSRCHTVRMFSAQNAKAIDWQRLASSVASPA